VGGSVVCYGLGLATPMELVNRLQAGKPPQYFTKRPRPTQPPILIMTEKEYKPSE